MACLIKPVYLLTFEHHDDADITLAISQFFPSQVGLMIFRQPELHWLYRGRRFTSEGMMVPGNDIREAKKNQKRDNAQENFR